MIRAHGLAHATLTVTDIKRTKAFYEELFGTEFEMDSKRVFSLATVGVPVWFVERPIAKKTNDRFNEKRVGLDHIAFKLENLSVLEKVVAKLQEMGVKTAGLEKYADKYPYVAFRDPDNIQTEFFIPKEV